ncbi:hypothetical protein CPC08DRAFT_734571 [Agrocybe pediades]|nr:hypothetical protein CPC08DRAFT_734571 [Agrocybe pediades]
MATLDYVDVPPGATRLRASPESTESKSTGIRPAPRIATSIPNPSPPSSPRPKRRPSILSSTGTGSLALGSLTSPTMSFIPQLLLSASMPPMTPGPTSGTPPASNIRKKIEHGNVTLLSSRDPLSLPIMTTNFKRFVSIVGPVFWLQDRIEEIVLWKKGWQRTSAWMAAYALICFYPRLILLLPHIALIGIILATYPYPAVASDDPLYTAHETSSQAYPTAAPVTEGSIPWQANIQGIQNLMGAAADLHDLIEPHLYHLQLTPQHFNKGRGSSTFVPQPSRMRSPYTTHILTLLFITFFPLLFIVHLPIFPIRQVALTVGLAPFILTHPYVKVILPRLIPLIIDATPILLRRFEKVKTIVLKPLGLQKSPSSGSVDDEILEEKAPMPPLAMVLQRVMDDDRLSDECWNSEMREVYLWENERYGGPLPSDSPTLAASSSGSSITPAQRGWSKLNLRPGERSAWTRGSDGWSGVGQGGGHSAVEVNGEVSSNLTFSLAPGWRFVETEDWRKDLQCTWSGCGGDADGWVYSNDAWLGSRPSPYTSGGGSVTRRRRWVRRVWYDPEKAKEDS